MKWITIKSPGNPNFGLPRDGKIFLALWKGRICITSFDTDEGRFYINFDPVYNSSQQVCQSREYKFTHWMELPEEPKFPEDYDMENIKE